MTRAGVILAAVVLAGCPSRKHDAPTVDASGLVIHRDSVVIRQGKIGVVRPNLPPPTDGTYVFAQVENQTGELRQVILHGELLDAAGKAVPLRDDELFIPPGETLPFALVHNVPGADARDVRLEIRRNEPPKHPRLVTVAAVRERHHAADSNEVVAGSDASAPRGPLAAITAEIENGHDQVVIATVIAAFYDAEGRILTRPFTILELAKRSSRSYTFEAPEGAVRYQAFVGEINY